MAPTPQKQIDDLTSRMDKQVEEQKNAVRALELKTQAEIAQSAFEHDYFASAERWERAARRIGSAYAKAVAKYKEVLAQQSATDALNNQLLFSVLTVAAGGALSWLVEKAKVRNVVQMTEIRERLNAEQAALDRVLKMPDSNIHKKKAISVQQNSLRILRNKAKPGELLVEALESYVQPAAEEGLSSLGAPLINESLSDPSIDPFVFQNSEANKISKIKESAHKRFADIRKMWLKWTLQQWQGYNVETQDRRNAEWLREAKTLAGDEDLPDDGEIRDQLEIGIWALFIRSASPKRVEFNGTLYYDTLRYLGNDIIDRLEEIGVTGFAGLSSSDITDAKGELSSGRTWLNIGTPNMIYVHRLAVSTRLYVWASGYNPPNLLYIKRSRELKQKIFGDSVP